MKFFAPGRVNLIGEHLDYNGGLVLPITISLGISLDMNLVQKKEWIFQSQNKPNFETNRLDFSPNKNQWYDYPLSIFNLLTSKGFDIPLGIEFSYQSSLPEGSGLSSSAAILVVTLNAMNKMFSLNLDQLTIAKMAQQAENEYLNVNCGIMDSFVIAHNVANSALLIDCNALSYQPIKIMFDENQLLIMNTKKPRKLQYSEYNERRTSCEMALSMIQKKHQIENLSRAKEIDLEILVENPIVYRRVRHVVSEQNRVLQSVNCLLNHDFSEFGNLLNQSHCSLKNDFEVSCEELDYLVRELQNQEFCFGSRMTGAGFGGCAIALLKKGNYDSYLNRVAHKYEKKFGWAPEFYWG